VFYVIRFSWLRVACTGGLLWTRYWTFGFHKSRVILRSFTAVSMETSVFWDVNPYILVDLHPGNSWQTNWLGYALAQMVSCRLSTTAAQVRLHVSLCGIYGGQNCAGLVFYGYFSFPCQLSFQQLLHFHLLLCYGIGSVGHKLCPWDAVFSSTEEALPLRAPLPLPHPAVTLPLAHLKRNSGHLTKWARILRFTKNCILLKWRCVLYWKDFTSR
jgi:hypothetical protein